MSGAATIFLVASIMYPGESVVEELQRIPMDSMRHCATQLRLVGNGLRGNPNGQFVLMCDDESAESSGEGSSMTAGYSLEKYLPDGAKPTQKSKAAKKAKAGAGAANVAPTNARDNATPYNGSP